MYFLNSNLYCRILFLLTIFRIQDVKRLENEIETIKGPKPDDGGPRKIDLEAVSDIIVKTAPYFVNQKQIKSKENLYADKFYKNDRSCILEVQFQFTVNIDFI